MIVKLKETIRREWGKVSPPFVGVEAAETGRRESIRLMNPPVKRQVHEPDGFQTF